MADITPAQQAKVDQAIARIKGKKSPKEVARAVGSALVSEGKKRGKMALSKARHAYALKRIASGSIFASIGGIPVYDGVLLASRLVGRGITSRALVAFAAGTAIRYVGHQQAIDPVADAGTGMQGGAMSIGRLGFLPEDHPIRVAFEKDADQYLEALKKKKDEEEEE